MAHYEIEFPLNDKTAYKSDGGPGFETHVIEADSGQESRVQRRTTPIRRFNASAQVRSLADITAVLTFYLRVGGVANSWLYKDWLDYNSTSVGRDWGKDGVQVSATDQQIGVGDGSTTQFQLKKTYGTSSPQHVRTITKPKAGTVRVALDGTEQLTGWSVDTTTGIVTFTTPPAASVTVTAGFEFFVPARFGEQVDESLRATIDAFDVASVPAIPIVEVLSPADDAEPYFHRGARALSIITDVALSVQEAVVYSITPGSAGLKAILPVKASTPLGGPIFVVENADTTNSIALEDTDTSTTVATLAAGDVVQVWLALDSGGSRVWKVLT